MNILAQWLEKAKDSFEFLSDFQPDSTHVANFLKKLTKPQRGAMLEHSVSLDPSENSNQSILSCAAESEADVECIEALLDGFSGDEVFPFVGRVDLNDCTPFDYAIIANDPAKVRALLGPLSAEQLVNLLNSTDDEGDTPLILAGREGNTEIVTTLLKRLDPQQLQTVLSYRQQGNQVRKDAFCSKHHSMLELLQTYGIPYPEHLEKSASSSSTSLAITPLRDLAIASQPSLTKQSKSGTNSLRKPLNRQVHSKGVSSPTSNGEFPRSKLK